MRSIEQNPVRADLVARPADYRWSSYAANALGEDNCILSPHEEYVQLGQTLPQRWEAYRALCDAELTTEALARIRNCTQSGTPMGSERFKAQIEQTLRRKVGSEKRDIVLKVRERRGSGLSKDLLSERHKVKPAHCRLRIQARLRFREYPEPKETQQRYGQG